MREETCSASAVLNVRTSRLFEQTETREHRGRSQDTFATAENPSEWRKLFSGSAL